MLPETHRFIIQHALQFKKKHFKGYKQIIEDACVNEDSPSLSLKYENLRLFGMDHFYHPDSDMGYFRFFGNAKKKGIYLLNRSLRLYKQGKKKDAFYTLGRSTHYLMDIASPSHTKLLFHLAEDDFERYVDENIHKFKFKIRAKVVPFIKPKDCFEKLARKSYKIEYRKKNYLFGLFLNLVLTRKQKDPEKKLNKISKKLIKQSIIHTIALLNAFNRKIVKHNLKIKKQKIVKKVKQKSKKLIS